VNLSSCSWLAGSGLKSGESYRTESEANGRLIMSDEGRDLPSWMFGTVEVVSVLRQIAELLWMLGRQEQQRRVQQYINTHKDTGYWLNLKEDTFDEEEWVWVEPETEVLSIPYYVQVVQVDGNKYQVYASREVDRDALEYCPCDTVQSIGDVMDIMAAGYKHRGEVEKISAIVAPRAD
jgi:hypothetical protein